MRLAILPITSFRHLKGESEIVMWTNQVRQWVQEHTDCWVYMILPHDCMEQGWEGADWPRTTVLWEDALGLYYTKMAEVPNSFAQLFDMRVGQYQIDGLITSRRGAAVQYARQAWDPRFKKTFPVFVDESMVVAEGRTPATVSEIEMVAQTLSYVVGWPVWDTDTQKENAIHAARHYLAGSQVLKALQRGVVIPCGFNPANVDRVVEQLGTSYELMSQRSIILPDKEDRFTAFFGGRLNRGSKRADTMLREYDSLFRFGRDMDVVVCSPKDEGWLLEMIKDQYPEVQVLTQTPSDEFKQRAARAHVFLNTSKQEGFSVGFAEMMYMTKYGTVLLAPRLPWVKGMFQELYDTYPFLYESFEQARTMLRYVYDDYAKAAREAKYSGLAEMVARRYDMKVTNEQHWQHYWSVIESELDGEFVRQLMSTANRELTMEAFETVPDRFELPVLYETMRSKSRAMKQDPRRGQTTMWAVRKWLQTEGLAIDTYDTPFVTMEKR